MGWGGVGGAVVLQVKFHTEECHSSISKEYTNIS